MQVPISFLDSGAHEEVSLEIWRDLLESVGGADLGDEELSYDRLRSFLNEKSPSSELLRALEAVHDLGTDEGRETLMEQATERSVVLAGRVPDDCGARELAVRLYLLQREDAAIAAVFERAQAHLRVKDRKSSFHEFRGEEPRAVADVERPKGGLEEKLRLYGRAKGLGEHVEVHAFDDDGICVFQVLRSDRTRTPLIVSGDSDTRSMIKFRPVQCDVLRYSALTGVLQVAAGRAPMVRQYQRMAGEVLFGDPNWFAGNSAWSLKRLQRDGQKCLDGHGLPDIGRVRMTECIWERGDRKVVHLKSNDCFEDVEQLGLQLADEGELVLAKLKVQVMERSTREVTVTLRVPSKLTVGSGRNQELMRTYLEAIGLRAQPAGSPLLDLWSMHPWRATRTAWRSLLQADVEALCALEALQPVVLDSIEHPDAPGGGKAMEVVEMDDGEFLGVEREEGLGPKTLSVTNVEGLELDVESFAAALAERFGCDDVLVRPGELIDFGRVSFGNEVVRPFLALRTPDANVGSLIRELAAGTPSVLLVPRGRKGGTDATEFELESALPSRQAFRRALVLGCQLEGRVPAIEYAPEGFRLVVDADFGMVWFDGVEVTNLNPGTQPFCLVEYLVRAWPEEVNSHELSRKISDREDDTGAARDAKRKAKKAIERALNAAGMDLDADPFFGSRCRVKAIAYPRRTEAVG